MLNVVAPNKTSHYSRFLKDSLYFSKQNVDKIITLEVSFTKPLTIGDLQIENKKQGIKITLHV
jgi:hypothetical protein